MHRAITRPLFARLDAIRRGAAAIGQGELDLRLPVQSRDELGLLIASFNRMAARLRRRERQVAADRAALEETIRQRTSDLIAANERLGEVDRSRRRFFADVSHELRTPLTVILGECDVGLRTLPAEAEGFRGVLGTIRKRAQRLQRRVEDLLRLARSESGQLELALKPVSVSTILAEAVETFAADAKRRGIALAFSPGAFDVEATADPESAAADRRGPDRQRAPPRGGGEPGRRRPRRRRRRRRDFRDRRRRRLQRARRGPVRALLARLRPGLRLRHRAALARWVVEQHGGQSPSNRQAGAAARG